MVRAAFIRLHNPGNNRERLGEVCRVECDATCTRIVAMVDQELTHNETNGVASLS